MFGLEAIWRNGQVVGHVRRADFGFTINKTLAYGYIRDPSGGPVSPPPPPPLPPHRHGEPQSPLGLSTAPLPPSLGGLGLGGPENSEGTD